MRRSTVPLMLALLVAGANLPTARAAQAATRLTQPAAVLVVGALGDPMPWIDLGIAATLKLARILEFVEEEFRRLKDEVRRGIEHPQRHPDIVPAGPLPAPELPPVKRAPASRRPAHPAPVPDSLPLRSIS
ncbi:MAG: hypothetical protein ABI960_09890 [Candidatus Eisenbacteria bacterium]